jgi:hypothetical protein
VNITTTDSHVKALHTDVTISFPFNLQHLGMTGVYNPRYIGMLLAIIIEITLIKHYEYLNGGLKC